MTKTRYDIIRSLDSALTNLDKAAEHLYGVERLFSAYNYNEHAQICRDIAYAIYQIHDRLQQFRNGI